MIAYAAITNTLLMTLYSMNNMPYSRSGRRHDRRVERAHQAEFLPLRRGQHRAVHGRRFHPAAGREVRRGPRPAIRLADDDDHLGRALPGALFITFLTTRERIQPVLLKSTSAKQDFRDLLKNSPVGGDGR